MFTVDGEDRRSSRPAHRRPWRNSPHSGSGPLSSVREQAVQEALAGVEEAPREAHGFGILVGDLLEPLLLAAVDGRLRIGEHDRRVGSNDELRALQNELVDAAQACEAVLRRERRLRFVEQVEPIATEAV